ncbi:MAG: amino acid permease [Candidatus Nanopelagicales bacterium]|nr:amino acid permease [Candidatus Nanopelagicales bacterium]
MTGAMPVHKGVQMSSGQPMLKQMMRVKNPDHIVEEGDHGGLKRSMGLFALLMFSVGSIIGTGIFVILGEAIPKAGPAVILSFVLAAVVCAFSALSYAELAGTIPVSGSSYSYAYATLGEILAWVCGWCLMLEYGVAVAAVAVGWGQYLNEFLSAFGIQIPPEFANPPGDGGVINIPAVFVVVACMFLLLRGASESATMNNIMVILKLAILAFFCIVAFTAFDGGNFQPFMPLGVAGIGAAAGQVFFSYIGFDAASTAGEEAKNPKRDLPIAIIGSLIIVTIAYLLVTIAAIGANGGQPSDYEGKSSEAVLAQIANDVTGSTWAGTLIALGAVVSIFSVVLVTMYGQTRILFAMGRDGLLPKTFTKVNPRTQTPVNNTIIVTVVISVLAALIPLGQLAEATSIGTLFAFMIVNAGVISLRRSRPNMARSFKTPFYPITPILGVLGCLYLILSLDVITWIVFFSWLAVGMVIYFTYGFRRSRLALGMVDDYTQDPEPPVVG